MTEYLWRASMSFGFHCLKSANNFLLQIQLSFMDIVVLIPIEKSSRSAPMNKKWWFIKYMNWMGTTREKRIWLFWHRKGPAFTWEGWFDHQTEEDISIAMTVEAYI